MKNIVKAFKNEQFGEVRTINDNDDLGVESEVRIV
ncbi:hypothetical protein M2140_000115 [Clostridiales Family XIII bacterium PM5-7]